jgi:hypothetical protein
MFGPQSISTINAVIAANDPDLVVETANCIVIRQLKSSPDWAKISPLWLQRFEAFSPATRRGVCPKLPATASHQAANNGSAAPAAAR